MGVTGNSYEIHTLSVRNSKTKNSTIMDKNISRIVKEHIHAVLNHQPDLLSAYIFGSYARNNQRTESDIDIALVIDNLADKDRFDT